MLFALFGLLAFANASSCDASCSDQRFGKVYLGEAYCMCVGGDGKIQASKKTKKRCGSKKRPSCSVFVPKDDEECEFIARMLGKFPSKRKVSKMKFGCSGGCELSNEKPFLGIFSSSASSGGPPSCHWRVCRDCRMPGGTSKPASELDRFSPWMGMGQ